MKSLNVLSAEEQPMEGPILMMFFGYRYDGTVPQSWCKKCRSLGSSCGYTDCPHWGDDYPRCYYSSKCPINDD